MVKTNWPVKTLGQILELSYGKPLEAKDRDDNGSIPVYGANGVKAYSKKSLVAGPSIIVGRKGSAGELNYCEGPFWPLDVTYYVKHDANETDLSFLHYLLSLLDLPSLAKGVKPGINRNDVYALQTTVPPLKEQKRIVGLLDAATARVTELAACYEQACTHANDLLESSLLELFADAFESQPKRKMGEVLQIARGGSPRPISEYITKSPNGVNWIKIGDASSSTKYIYETAQKIKPEGVSRSRMVYPGDFLLSNSMSFGRPYIMKTEGCIHDGWLVLRDSKGELDQDFLFYMLGSRFMYERFSQLAAGSTVQNLNSALVSNIEIPVPPIDFQKTIAEKARLLEENVARLNEVNEIRVQHASNLRQSMLEAAFAGEL